MSAYRLINMDGRRTLWNQDEVTRLLEEAANMEPSAADVMSSLAVSVKRIADRLSPVTTSSGGPSLEDVAQQWRNAAGSYGWRD